MSEEKKLTIQELAAAYGVAMQKVNNAAATVASLERDLRRAERDETQYRENAKLIYEQLQYALAADAALHS